MEYCRSWCSSTNRAGSISEVTLTFTISIFVLGVAAFFRRLLRNVGPIYGLMLTVWGFASAFGPLLIAHMRQADGVYHGTLHLIAGLMAVSVVLP